MGTNEITGDALRTKIGDNTSRQNFEVKFDEVFRGQCFDCRLKLVSISRHCRLHINKPTLPCADFKGPEND